MSGAFKQFMVSNRALRMQLTALMSEKAGGDVFERMVKKADKDSNGDVSEAEMEIYITRLSNTAGTSRRSSWAQPGDPTSGA